MDKDKDDSVKSNENSLVEKGKKTETNSTVEQNPVSSIDRSVINSSDEQKASPYQDKDKDGTSPGDEQIPSSSKDVTGTSSSDRKVSVPPEDKTAKDICETSSLLADATTSSDDKPLSLGTKCRTISSDEQVTSSQERKRTRSSEANDTQRIAEPLPPKKPRLEYESEARMAPDPEDVRRDSVLSGSSKAEDVLEIPEEFIAIDTRFSVLSPEMVSRKMKESSKSPSPPTDRKIKKPKHHKRLPILLEAPITEKYTVFMKNDRWKVVGGGMQGWRIRMEDAHVSLLETPLDPSVSFFGVFDGHGGNEVSTYAARHLYKFILKNDRFRLGDIDFAIKEGYMDIDKHMREKEIGKFRQGTTAITVTIKDGIVYCANVGDSRAIAVIDGEVVPLSVDQKPTLPEEADRIAKAGLPILNNRVSGGLAMSRSLGDFRYKSFRHLSALQQPVIAQPVVVKKELTDAWEFVVIACDGIWDVMSNDLVAAFVKDKIKSGICLSEICESLFMKCLAPSAFFPNKGCDNMTAIIILFSEEVTKSTCLRVVTNKEEYDSEVDVNG